MCQSPRLTRFIHEILERPVPCAFSSTTIFDICPITRALEFERPNGDVPGGREGEHKVVQKLREVVAHSGEDWHGDDEVTR
jgi:hypothetical protein